MSTIFLNQPSKELYVVCSSKYTEQTDPIPFVTDDSFDLTPPCLAFWPDPESQVKMPSTTPLHLLNG